MAENLRGNQVVSGASGTLWLNNDKVMELININTTVTANRDSVLIGLSEDSKLISLAGTGSLEINKVYSRAKAIINDWKKGRDPRMTISVALKDPDSPDGQIERISLDNVWFNDINIINIATGAKITETYNFGFTPSDAAYEEAIS